MNKQEQYNFLKEFKELLDKYNIEIITCGCCGGMGFIEKNTNKEIIDMVSSNEIEEKMKRLESENK